MARSHPAAHGSQPRLGRPGLGLQGNPPADARQYRPPARSRSGRAGHCHRRRAGSADGLAPRHHLRRQRRGIRRDAAGWARGPHVAGRPHCHSRAFQPWRADPALQPGDLERSGRSRHLEPLQSPARDHDHRRPGAGLSAWRCHCLGAAGRAGRASRICAGGLERRVARVPAIGQCGVADLRHGAAGGVSGAGRAVRKLRAPVGDHADGAIGGAGRAGGAVADRRHAQPVQSDRHRDAGGPGGQERHPDRGIRQPVAR